MINLQLPIRIIGRALKFNFKIEFELEVQKYFADFLQNAKA